jgi:hypothetical protein
MFCSRSLSILPSHHRNNTLAFEQRFIFYNRGNSCGARTFYNLFIMLPKQINRLAQRFLLNQHTQSTYLWTILEVIVPTLPERPSAIELPAFSTVTVFPASKDVYITDETFNCTTITWTLGRMLFKATRIP